LTQFWNFREILKLLKNNIILFWKSKWKIKICYSNNHILNSAKNSILLDSQHPQSLEKIRNLEAPRIQQAADSQQPSEQPQFVQPLNSCLDLLEGQPAHFEAHVRPTNDPHLKIIWFHNGQQLMSGSRMTMSHDFGLIVLNISGCIAEDNGIYTCIAKNDAGQTETSGELICQGILFGFDLLLQNITIQTLDNIYKMLHSYDF